MDKDSIIITDEHLSSLGITPEGILLLKVPIDTSNAALRMAMEEVKKVVFGSVGYYPGLLIIPADVELTSMRIDQLENMRNEIDGILQWKLSAEHGVGDKN